MGAEQPNKAIGTSLPANPEAQKRIILGSTLPVADLLSEYHTSLTGLTADQVNESRDTYGINRISKTKKVTVWSRIAKAFLDPFTGILLVLAIVSLFTNVILPPAGEKNPATVIIIFVMTQIAGWLRFTQEYRSDKSAEKLSDLVETTTAVEREGIKSEIPLDEVVVGDLIHLSAGDIIPADVRIISSKDLFVSQAALTGESESIEKSSLLADKTFSNIPERNNLGFMGTTVLSGSAKAIVILVGNDTLLGKTAKSLSAKVEKTNFEKGISSVSWLLIRFMLVMVPVVLLVNGFTKGNWLEAVLFALSVAVGLTPEMLPMIMTTTLAKGAVRMARKKTIIKSLNSIQSFGSMDVLCTDKTGTLTQDRVALQYHLDVAGNPNIRVLRHGFINSYFQTGLKNLMDHAVIDKTEELEATYPELRGLVANFEKVDEIPFDFTRRRMTVVVSDKTGKTQMITKGAVEEILNICSYVEFDGSVQPFTGELKTRAMATVDNLNDSGMRVIAVAQKNNPSSVNVFSVKDESEMVLIGYLAFYDPPKQSAAAALRSLRDSGVDIKVLTGDNDRVTKAVCRQVGLHFTRVVLGSDIETLDEKALRELVEKAHVFAKLSPEQKARVVLALKANGHVVGYMGDGINDAPALRVSDVGISVDTAVDIAKESAKIILLEKDLNVLNNGIIEGRKTYANLIKYVKMTASSNFGNMLSVVLASAFLPFLPMLPVHLLLLNLVYDISCASIPWDNVDAEYLAKPRKWDASGIGKFMMWIGPTSSVFDITTYLLMFFVICPQVVGGGWSTLTSASDKMLFISLFETGWFVESMWSQTFVIHMLRTPKIPFIQSHASWILTTLTLLGVATITFIPYTAIGASIGLTPLPGVYFLWLLLTVVLYMLLATVFKKIYIKKYGSLL